MADENIQVSMDEIIAKIEAMKVDLERLSIVLNSINQQQPGLVGELPGTMSCVPPKPWKC